MNFKLAVFLISIIFYAGIISAQYAPDLGVIHKIKNESFNHSQVYETTVHICDIYGPRLTGSPAYLKAANFVVEKMKEWGIENAYIEPWGTFGRGWQVEKVSAEMTKPNYMSIIAYPKSWTGSTNGIVTGKPIMVSYEDTTDLEKYKGTLSGKIVLLGKPRKADIHFEPDARRYSQEKLSEIAQAPIPGEKSKWESNRAQWNRKKRLRKYVNEFMANENVAVIIEASEREHGTIRVHRGGSRKIGDPEGIPSLKIAIEQYSRLWRMLERNVDVDLKIEVKNKFFENDSLGRNVIAEIPGNNRSKRNEIVMLGAHLDSWHAGTGATDNGANCAVIMEAMRIIHKLNLNNKRTIRMVLWDGEEQGYYGSEGYIEKHIGNLETLELLDGHKNISAYFNLDNGAGKIRGVYLQENDAARPIFESWFKPFNDMGVETISIKRTTGTDHIPFNNIGLPGFQFIQDPINYMNRTHHTNMDVVDNLIESDLIHNATVIASIVYHAAMMEEKFPRKVMPEKKEED